MKKLRYFIATKLMRIVEWLDPFVQRRNIIVETTEYRLVPHNALIEIPRRDVEDMRVDGVVERMYIDDLKRNLARKIAENFVTTEKSLGMDGGIAIKATVLMAEKIKASQ